MKGQRTERLIRITSKFLASPSSLISLTGLAEDFGVSKTVISDDVAMVNEALLREGYGHLVVDRGRTGGAFYVPDLSPERRKTMLTEVARILSDPSRVLPGRVLYYADILFNPVYSRMLGLAFASDFKELHPTMILTSEVKGIPLGYSAAHALGVPLAVARFRNRPSDGPAVCVHFPTQSGEVRSMYLGTKLISSEDRVLIIDDFIHGGSTVAGMCQVVKEFRAEVLGLGVFVEEDNQDHPMQVRFEHFKSLLNVHFNDKGVSVTVSE